MHGPKRTALCRRNLRWFSLTQPNNGTVHRTIPSGGVEKEPCFWLAGPPALTGLMSVWRCSSIGVDLSTRHLFGLPGSDWCHAVVDTLLLCDGQDTAVVHGWRARVESFDVACWFASPSSKSNKPLLPDSLGLRCSFLCAAPRRPYLFAFWEVRGSTTGILGMGTQLWFWFKLPQGEARRL